MPETFGGLYEAMDNTTDLHKKIPIIKSDWDCEVIPTEKGGYGYTLIIYKNGDEAFRRAGYGAISAAQQAARDYVLAEEFGIDREEQE